MKELRVNSRRATPIIEPSTGRRWPCLLGLALLLTLITGAADARGGLGRFHVNCDRGQSVAKVLRYAPAGSRIDVRGTCYEQLLIRRDRIRLRGLDDAVIDGSTAVPGREGTIVISQADGVRISSLQVRNGTDQGITVQESTGVRISRVVATGNATVGVVVDRSQVELSAVDASTNSGGGFDIFTSSTVVATGPLTANDNGGAGLALNANSMLELRGSILTTLRNLGDGVLVVNDSDLMILSFPEAQGSGVVAQENAGNAGVFVASSSVSIVGSNFFGAGNNVFDISRNGVGMLFTTSSLSSPFANAVFNLSNNGVGLLFADGADGFVVGGLNIRGNAFGILADGAGVLNLQQNDTTASDIQGNGVLDVSLGFGTRAKIQQAISIGSLACDSTVITPEFLAPGEAPVYACP